MTRKFFGTDGIRGTVGKSPITPDFLVRLGNSVGWVLKAECADTRASRPVVVIGKDTRISGYMLESALESGLNSAGVDVVLLGPMPTPGVAFITQELQASLGVVISASHNPYPDNGIKFFSSEGTKLSDTWEQKVESQLEQECLWVCAQELGRTRRLVDAAEKYTDFCLSKMDVGLSLKGLRIVVDGAHGAAYQIGPRVFERLGAEVMAIGCTPDGFNINEGFGATHPENLVKAVREHKADYGVALDGDADRLQMVDAAGRLYNGDELLYVMTRDRVMTGQNVRGVVGTLMTNVAIEHGLRRLGCDFVRVNVGDRYILEALHQRGWTLGGESSGHLLALDKHSTGDGLLSALLVLQACARSGQRLHEMLSDVHLFPQTLLNVRLEKNVDWRKHAGFQAEVQAVEHELGDEGRVLIRASGTEPVLRVMVEAQDPVRSRRSAERLVKVLTAA